MKYRIEVIYRTAAIKKMQGYLDRIIPGKELLARCTYECSTEEPLTDEEISKMEDCCPDWADSISVYPA